MGEKPSQARTEPLEIIRHEASCALPEQVLDRNGFTMFPQPVVGDHLDPLNWPSVQKHVALAIVMSMYFMFTYITTTTVPSFPELQERYSINLDQVNWTVAIPALGLSVGPLIWASMADIIGRRPILLLGTAIALASTVGAALAPTYSGYMAARFFQGLGVSPASNVGLAVINDLFFEHERGQKVGLWVLAIDLGLLFGPLIGGAVNLAGPNWTQWLSAIIFGVILAAQLAFLPETLYPRHLMLSQTLGDNTPRQVSEKASTTIDKSDIPRTKQLAFVSLVPVPGVKHPKPQDTIVRFFKTFRYVVIPMSIIGYCFSWYWWVLSVVTLIPTAYDSHPPEIQGLFYLGLIIGTLLSEFLFSGGLSDRIVVRLSRGNNGQRTPEMRLWLAYPAAVMTAVGLIVWGISVDQGYHWIVGQIAFVLFGAGIQMGNTAICSYVVDAYPLQSMASMTFYSVMLNLSAFADPFFIVPWVEKAGFTWTFAAHAMMTVFLCVPVVLLLHVRGAKLRNASGTPSWVNPEFEQAATQDIWREN